MTETHPALNHLQHVFFLSCLHSERFHSLFSSVEAGLNSLCNFHQANKGKQWYKSVKSGRRFLHLTLCFTQACNDPLLNAGKAAFDCHPFWSPFEWKYLIFRLRFPSPLIHQLKAFWLLSEELSSNMQKKLTVTIVAYYDIQKEQLTIWDAKIRPKCMHAGRFFSVCVCVFFFFYWLQNDNKIHRL